MSTPSELYRNAIDLNRFSNSVAKRIARTYNDLILDAVNHEKKMIVDVKNKQFTEKGDKKIASYDDIKSCLNKKK